jgi:hypothetical protein
VFDALNDKWHLWESCQMEIFFLAKYLMNKIFVIEVEIIPNAIMCKAKDLYVSLNQNTAAFGIRPKL